MYRLFRGDLETRVEISSLCLRTFSHLHLLGNYTECAFRFDSTRRFVVSVPIEYMRLDRGMSHFSCAELLHSELHVFPTDLTRIALLVVSTRHFAPLGKMDETRAKDEVLQDNLIRKIIIYTNAFTHLASEANKLLL